MKDTLGTILGFVIGFSLIFLGIIFPDQYSNYYVYKITTAEQLVSQLEEQRRPRAEIMQAKDELQKFKESLMGSISRFVDLKSFGIVAGGAFAATLIAFPLSRALRTFRFIIQAFGKDTVKEAFMDVYETVLNLAEKRNRGEVITDDEIEEISSDYLRTWVQDFISVDVVSEDMISEIIESEINMYNYRSLEEINVLDFLGKTAPAFGMVGTVVGLILMLGAAAGEGASIADVMGAMSVALITTLYGVLLAQLFFIPVATKRHQLKESNIKLMEMIHESILYLKRREVADVAAQDLAIYLPLKERQEIEQERLEQLQSGQLGL
ncbi:MAG: MotA/TolQ/ExbB proton channel family protein [Deltaproteobacteria bacterium]|nr:MotA/TolQ/ExbB proton channel family protein [Deltaproteobacteria bacterium]